jgi:hypothetical protein
MFAFCPKTEGVILVIIFDASMVINTDAEEGMVVSVYAGIVNDREDQSFRKNPIVFAIGGSTGGWITPPPFPPPPFPPPLSVEVFFAFNQEENNSG